MAPSSCKKSGVQINDWLLCELTPPCLVFSVGIGNEWTFDKAALDAGCEVHSFDPTISLLKKHRAQAARYRNSGYNLHFHEVGLGTSTEYEGIYGSKKRGGSGLSAVASLSELILRHAGPRKIDILKVDCEGCEWSEFARLATQFPSALCAVGQLYMELHVSSTLGIKTGRQGLRDISIFHGHLQQHGFSPFMIKLVPGAFPDQDHVPKPLRETGIDPVACCYNVHMQRIDSQATNKSMCHTTRHR